MKLETLLVPFLLLACVNFASAGHNLHVYGQQSGDAWARDYAETALRQVRQNQRRHCGYEGQRWVDSYRAHYRWALRVNWRTSQGEIEQREADLRRCGSRRGYLHGRHDHERGHDRGRHAYSQRGSRARFNRDELARWYAETALAQVGASNRHGCRLSSSSGRWSRSWRDHYRWALGQPRAALLSEVRRRDEIIENCASYAYRGR